MASTSQVFDADDTSAQDVVDALRFVTTWQKDSEQVAKIVDVLLEFAPATENDRGLSLLTHLVVVGGLKLVMADA